MEITQSLYNEENFRENGGEITASVNGDQFIIELKMNSVRLLKHIPLSKLRPN